MKSDQFASGIEPTKVSWIQVFRCSQYSVKQWGTGNENHTCKKKSYVLESNSWKNLVNQCNWSKSGSQAVNSIFWPANKRLTCGICKDPALRPILLQCSCLCHYFEKKKPNNSDLRAGETLHQETKELDLFSFSRTRGNLFTMCNIFMKRKCYVPKVSLFSQRYNH